MLESFSGKVAVVTGGAKGIGGAITTELARRGAHVVINCFHSVEQARELAATITAEMPGSAEVIRASVVKRAELADMFARVEEAHGGIDFLVNNAARAIMDPLDRVPDIEWERCIDVDLHGTRMCTEYAVPLMERRGGGSIVNISVIATRYPLANYTPGAPAKAAMEAFSRYAAAELGPAGIRVNIVSTGFVDNDTTRLFPDSERMRDTLIAATPMGRLPAERELAEVTVFLCSSLAGSITGQTLDVDGGLSLFSAALSPPVTARPAWTTTGEIPAPRGLTPAAGSDDVDGAQPQGSDTAATARPVAPVIAEAGEAGRDRPEDNVIAVVGMGMVVPGANSPDEFWDLLRQPDHTFGEPPRFDIDQIYSADPEAEDRSYVRTFGFIRDFRPHPGMRVTDPDRPDLLTRYLRHSVLQARDGMRIAGSARCGLYVGAWTGSSHTLEDSMLVSAAARGAGARLVGSGHESRLRGVLRRHFGQAVEQPRRSLPDAVLRDAAADLLGDDAEYLVVDTACSSSMYAIDLGVKGLLAGDCDVAFCGGAGSAERRVMVLFSKLKGLSPTGELRAYDIDANGVLFSECTVVLGLKRLSTAREDGDEVLGLLAGFGAASDGRGKAIAAPNETGQRRALQRARAVNGVTPEEVDWVVGHGTGTPAGDAVELETLAEHAPDGGQLVTSNKSLVGHGGWTAGAVSVAHALLALRNETIPAQQRFSELHPATPADRIRVPSSDVPWPGDAQYPRQAGVSAFGFGGINAHQLVREAGPRGSEALPASTPATTGEDVVLLGWSAHLPGAPDRDAVRAWLTRDAAAPERSFGDRYPLPPLAERKLPDVTALSIDRCQLMAIELTNRFVREHGEIWAQHRERTGVIAGHTGIPRAMVDYSLRIAQDELCEAVRRYSDTPEADERAMREFLDDHRREMPPSNEESMSGVMTNIIASRISHRFDMHGPTMAVDAGHASTQAAVRVAERYLRTGELDMALVLSVNGNSTAVNSEFVGVPQEELAEGAFLLALTREGMASEHGWPVRARLRSLNRDGERDEPSAAVAAVAAGSPHTGRSYLAGDGAVELIRAVESGRPHATVRSPAGSPSIAVSVPTREAAGPPAATAGEQASGGAPDVAASERYCLVTRRVDATAEFPEVPAIPAGGIVLVNRADLAERVADQVARAGATMISTDPETSGCIALDAGSEEAMAAAVDSLAVADGEALHLRVLATVRDIADRWPEVPPPSLLRLPELALMVCQRYTDRLDGGTIAALLLDELRDANIHPYLSLVSGFIRGIRREVPARTWAVATDAPLETALSQLAAESAAADDRSVARYHRGVRLLERLRPAPAGSGGEEELLVDSSSVVLATGGARGIAAVALAALARRARPKLWLLGSTPDEPVPDELLDATDEELPALRARFIRDARQEYPEQRVPEINARFDRLLRARQVRTAVRELRALLGESRVRYLECDVTDAEAVRYAVETIHAEDGRVTLVVHAAGRNKSALYDSKTIADYRSVRDPKVLGYHNLKGAFGDRQPRHWCTFGSVLGTFGITGETDYIAANEYLAAAACRNSRHRSTAEFTIGWSTWGESGMRAGPGIAASQEPIPLGITDARGRADFLTELSVTRPPEPYSLYLPGDTLRRSAVLIGEHITEDELNSVEIGRGMLGVPIHRDRDTAQWEWQAELGRDSYVLEHLVGGKPVAPGQLMVALAGEAGLALLPGATVRGWRDISFENFLFTDPRGKATPYRLLAEVVERSASETRVHVAVEADVIAPDGRVLQRGRRYCAMEVLLGTPRAMPEWQPGDLAGMRGHSTVDPYHRPDSEAWLIGPFRTTSDVTVSASGGHGRWVARVDCDALATARLPVLLLDSLLRSRSFEVADGERITTHVPTGIAVIDLYAGGNDVELTRRYPSGIDLYYDAGSDTCTAVTPEGGVLLRMSGIGTQPMSTMPIDDTQLAR
ncbi:SDR family oxidoreductase [Haloechinothrix sp. LS1_15]|uniref:SDR family oxidoreductase n=1 Tax=Haloechinothrix sp. LS1_15 TaxID=2652248 RepID=UPI0029449892|nr:SDR family oxidoreductase [Haloechinothrix sp. LS1_15]MDV6012198.1 SDR family oxidoreductase [Haloechinothrix sp. LS1_15]